MIYYTIFVPKSLMILSTIICYGYMVEGGEFLFAGATSQMVDGNVTEVRFLSIQSSQSGSISQINNTAHVLELNNVSDKTILFSDRPNRIVTTMSTNDFVGNWSIGEDSFSEDAPNAVLVADDLLGLDTSTMVLFDPLYDKDKKTLTYKVTPDNATSIELPKDLGKSTLIIDAHPTSVNSQITD